MAGPKKPIAASSRVPPRLLQLLRESGSDATAIERQLGLPPGSEHAEEVALTGQDFERLLEVAAQALDDPLLALHLPERLRWQSYNVGELAAYASPTLGEAFERVVRYASLFYAPLSFACEVKGEDFVVVQRLRGAVDAGRYANEFALASTLFYARRYSGVLLQPRAVSFAHAEPPELERVRQHFGTPNVRYRRRENSLVFALADVDRPSLGGDPRLLATAEKLADTALAEVPATDDFIGSVAAQLRTRLSHTTIDARTIARRLRLSPRTLQRRLEDAGTTFSALVDGVRRDAALEAICDHSLTLEQAAQRVGFSDAKAFGRAFKRWTGRSPGAYRKPNPVGEPNS